MSGSHLERGAERRRLLRAIERDDDRRDEAGADDAVVGDGDDVSTASVDGEFWATAVEVGDQTEVAGPAVPSETRPASVLLSSRAGPEEPTEDGDA